jgi:hypothetical protein
MKSGPGQRWQQIVFALHCKGIFVSRDQLNPELASPKRVHEVGPRFARLSVVKINTMLQNNEVTEIGASVLALALVLPE